MWYFALKLFKYTLRSINKRKLNYSVYNSHNLYFKYSSIKRSNSYDRKALYECSIDFSYDEFMYNGLCYSAHSSSYIKRPTTRNTQVKYALLPHIIMNKTYLIYKISELKKKCDLNYINTLYVLTFICLQILL